MKKQVTLDGNEACSMSAYMFTELAGIYPITPSSPMAEHCDEWSSKDVKNIFGDKDDKYKEMADNLFINGIMDEKEYTSVINKKDKNRDDFER